ncbi:zinc ribbon domain-containing protein [Terrisporobacter sp.]
MFFIGGIYNREKKLDYTQNTICSSCGAFDRMEVFMTYMCFSLFFIPIFKWNKKYYVKYSCCDSVYILDDEVGKKISYGDDISISESDLRILNNNTATVNKCNNCGYIYDSSFNFCPKCGQKL